MLRVNRARGEHGRVDRGKHQRDEQHRQCRHFSERAPKLETLPRVQQPLLQYMRCPSIKETFPNVAKQLGGILRFLNLTY